MTEVKAPTGKRMIKSYKFTPRRVFPDADIYDASTKTFKPLDFEFIEIGSMLDSIAIAVESGVIDKDGWVKQIFATPAVFNDFIEHLSSYDSAYRITDQWWMALMALSGRAGDEEGFITCEEIADGLVAGARRTGQL